MHSREICNIYTMIFNGNSNNWVAENCKKNFIEIKFKIYLDWFMIYLFKPWLWNVNIQKRENNIKIFWLYRILMGRSSSIFGPVSVEKSDISRYFVWWLTVCFFVDWQLFECLCSVELPFLSGSTTKIRQGGLGSDIWLVDLVWNSSPYYKDFLSVVHDYLTNIRCIILPETEICLKGEGHFKLLMGLAERFFLLLRVFEYW